METKELRIGNLVTLGSYNEDFQKVEGLTEDMVKLPDSTNNLWVHKSMIYGVPLTPEILEMCGLRIAGTGYYWIAVREHYNASNELKPTWLKIKYTQAKNFRVENFANKTIYLKSLHQLQNLYFALTGYELEVKL